MKTDRCAACGQTFPLRETFLVDDAVLCRRCAEEFAAEHKDLPEGRIRGRVDPTVCGFCRKDQGEADLPKVAGVPACADCSRLLRHRPFPTWVKCSAAAISIVLVGSLFWNARFFLGYGEMRQAMRAFAARDSGQAARLMSAASRHVPERPELGVFAALFEGVDLLQRDKAAEALPVLVKCRGKLPPHWRVEDLLLRAEIAAAFDAKNYDRFLELALQMQQGAPNDPQAAAPAASAYACKYAVTGKEEFRQQALRLLDKAKAAGDSKELREYEDRILHRLETREILSRREFQQKFPNGWGPSRKKPT